VKKMSIPTVMATTNTLVRVMVMVIVIVMTTTNTCTCRVDNDNDVMMMMLISKIFKNWNKSFHTPVERYPGAPWFVHLCPCGFSSP
jgi:hypothetical protein